MSVDIIFSRYVAVCEGENGPLFALFEEHGCNNSRLDNGSIYRSWSLTAFGSLKTVVARVTKMAGACAGGSLQHGYGNSYYSVSPAGFVDAWFKAIYVAKHETLGRATITTSTVGRYRTEAEAQTEYERACEISTRRGAGLISESTVTWDLDVPHDASAYAEYRASGTRSWTYSSEVAQHPTWRELPRGYTFTMPGFGVADKGIMTEFVESAYQFVGDRNDGSGRRFLCRCSGKIVWCYAAMNHVATHVAELVMQGYDPRPLLRAGERVLKVLDFVPYLVQFSVPEASAKMDSDWQHRYLGGVRQPGEVVTTALPIVLDWAIPWTAASTVLCQESSQART